MVLVLQLANDVFIILAKQTVLPCNTVVCLYSTEMAVGSHKQHCTIAKRAPNAHGVC